MIKTIEFKNGSYPAFQATGNAARFAIPYALEVCKGQGYDIGCGRKDWAFPEATCIDLQLSDPYNAYYLPAMEPDYIFSSHCLEHLEDWVKAMDYWHFKLRPGGTLFLYLPHYSQEYWRPWNNRKHLNILTPKIIKDYLEAKGYRNIFIGKRDLNNSFMAMAQK